MLAVQMHLTNLNAKSEMPAELIAEFDRCFSNEPVPALKWAFRVWRDQSSFHPGIADIRKLLKEWRRGERERLELEARMDERFLLEEGRRQGQVLSFGEVVRQVQEAVKKMPQPEHEKKEERFAQKMASISQIIPTLNLSEEQIAARRARERNECEKYRSYSSNEFCG
jgi:hypothetical protein